MSCGNRFQCGLSKATRFSFQPDKPSNPELFNENQKKLNDLLKARDEMDKMYSHNTSDGVQSEKIESKNITSIVSIGTINHLDLNNNVQTFTPWKIPSTHDFNNKSK